MKPFLANKTLNFDAQASTPTDKRVIEAMLSVLQNNHANPHSNHLLGWQANTLIDKAKESVAELLGAFKENIVFTSGATEANNQAIASVLKTNTSDSKTILISSIEHKSVSEPIYFYAEKYGYTVKEIPVNDEGLVCIDEYEELLKRRPFFVSIISVNNEIGVIQDIKTLAKLASDFGAVFHTDAAQAVQVVDIDKFIDDIDILTLSAHKFYGPQGVGVLYFSPRIQDVIKPLMHGGGQQEGMRSGTCPTFLCAALGKAAELIRTEKGMIQSRLRELSSYFLLRLDEVSIPYRMNGSALHRHHGNVNIELIGVDAETLLNTVQPHICASTGSACNSGNIEASKVLKAIGLDERQAKSSIRFSFDRFMTIEGIETLVSLIAEKREFCLTR